MKNSSLKDKISNGVIWVKLLLGMWLFWFAHDYHDVPPALEDIQVDTLENMDSLNLLKSMILTDAGAESEQSFYISKNHIGRAIYYDQRILSLRRSGFKGEKLKDALEEVNLTPERYQEYLVVLQLLDAKWVGFKPESESLENNNHINPGHVEIFLYSHSCDTKAIFNTDSEIPESNYEDNHSYEVLPLSGGWYLGHLCFS